MSGIGGNSSRVPSLKPNPSCSEAQAGKPPVAGMAQLVWPVSRRPNHVEAVTPTQREGAARPVPCRVRVRDDRRRLSALEQLGQLLSRDLVAIVRKISQYVGTCLRTVGRADKPFQTDGVAVVFSGDVFDCPAMGHKAERQGTAWFTDASTALE